MKDPALYLNHIAECIARIQGYTDQGRDAFLSNHMMQDAVLRNLQVMAESTIRLPETVKAQSPEVNWKGLSGFRNRLVHDYLGGISLERVWEFIRNDLFVLQSAVSRLLAHEKLTGL